eukprot:8022776-Karenia_brevis.AAC.1
MWSASSPPSQRAKRVGNGRVWCHCSMRSQNWSTAHDVIRFSASVSACEKGGQWQRCDVISKSGSIKTAFLDVNCRDFAVLHHSETVSQI